MPLYDLVGTGTVLVVLVLAVWAVERIRRCSDRLTPPTAVAWTVAVLLLPLLGPLLWLLVERDLTALSAAGSSRDEHRDV